MANIRSFSISALTTSIFLAILMPTIFALPAKPWSSISMSLAVASSGAYWQNTSIARPNGNITLTQPFIVAGSASSSPLSFITSNATKVVTFSTSYSPVTPLYRNISDLVSPVAQGGNISTSSAPDLRFLSSPSPVSSEVQVATENSTVFKKAPLQPESSRRIPELPLSGWEGLVTIRLNTDNTSTTAGTVLPSSAALLASTIHSPNSSIVSYHSSWSFPSTLRPTMTESCSCGGCTSSSWFTGRQNATAYSPDTTVGASRSSANATVNASRPNWAFLSGLSPMRTAYCLCEGCTSSRWATSIPIATAGVAPSAPAPLFTPTTIATNSTANLLQSSWADESTLPPFPKGSCSFEGCMSSVQPTPTSQHIIEPTTWGSLPPAPLSSTSDMIWSTSWANAPPTPESTTYHTVLTWTNVPAPTPLPPSRPTVTVWIARPVSTVATVYTITTVSVMTGAPIINTIYTTTAAQPQTPTMPVPSVVVVFSTVTSVRPAPPPRQPPCSKHRPFDCCIYEDGYKDGIRECYGPGPRPGHPQCHWATIGCCADYVKGYFIPGSCRDCVEVC